MGLLKDLFGPINKLPDSNQPVPTPQESKDLKTIKAAIVGTHYPCLWPKGIYGNRTRALSKSKLGDSVSLRVYEYEGSPAIAVINNRLGVDIGVIKQESVQRILKILHDNDVKGKITKRDSYFENNDEENGELIYTCTVQLFYTKRN